MKHSISSDKGSTNHIIVEFQLFISNAIKADLRNISKTLNQSKDFYQEQQRQQASRFLSILYGGDENDDENDNLSLKDKIEKVIKPCIKLICGFIHNLSSKEKISKESILNRLISNCKLTIYVLFEIFMYPNSSILKNSLVSNKDDDNDETMNNNLDEDNSIIINSEIASYFGLYDELVCFMIMFSYDENFLETLTLMNPQRFSNIKVEHSSELMKQFLNRIFNWICVTSVENEIQHQLSSLGYQIVFKHLIHSIQNVIFKSLNNNGNGIGFHSTHMNIAKYWFRKLWKHDSSLMKPHLIELLKRLFIVMKVKRTNQFHSTFNIYMNELIQSLMKSKTTSSTDEEATEEDFSKFILQSLKEIITNTTEEIEAKNQAIIMYYNLLIDDIDNIEDHNSSIVKSFVELMFDKVLFTNKNADCRITALEMIQKIVESKFYKRRINQQSNNQANIVPINRILNQTSHVLKFDPNQSVRKVSFDLWLLIFDLLPQQGDDNNNNQQHNLLILSNMLHIKSRDKEKRIRVKVFEKITEMGIFRFNQSLLEQMKHQDEYSEPIVSNKSLKLTRIVRTKKISNDSNHSTLVCHVLREILIIGMLDEEKKVRDLTEQLFVDLVLSELNPLELMKELEESYHEIVRTTTVIGSSTDERSQKPTCWALFEGVLKGNINNLYSKQL
ncbi:predicted protein [Naegleria gruberi]|uniref:Predicted protein n=1 Tax=Naegleria gruberi TaxID=5762 RepID=D2V213_NAEGR|nr:uncharacterized protein NAEGRDRAFT_62842 [Naegleria gruberi]EFC48822.1 predicted protein [Naegleria gruberi]|eukprot:XP_002681566.1 predicted protein [Naegleria gruberi strain NEG-M]